MEPILLVLILAVVVLAGGGFAISARRRRGIELEPPPRDRTRPVTPRPAATGTLEAPATPTSADAPPDETVVDDDLRRQVDEALAEPEPEPEIELEPEIEIVPPPVKPRFRDRLGKARSLLSTYFGSVLSRTAIDQETWDELEEALIRADVGAGLTSELLDDLSARVKAQRHHQLRRAGGRPEGRPQGRPRRG